MFTDINAKPVCLGNCVSLQNKIYTVCVCQLEFDFFVNSEYSESGKGNDGRSSVRV